MASDDAQLDLASARRELYGVKPAEFVAVRSELAKRARAAGDKGLADEIQALRKPTLAAWLVNALAREEADDLGELLELGRDMREGMGGVDADGLRQLTRKRHQLVAGLVGLARELGAANGLRVADDAARAVQTTLEATLSDAESAEAVAEGCLSEPLQPSGFGFGFGGPGDATVTDIARPPATVSDIAASSATVTDIADRRAQKEAEIADAEEGLADAEHLAQQAERAYEEARQRTADAARRADKASDKIDKLQARLDEARAELAEESSAVKAARQAESDAEKAMRAATRALASATELLRRLRR
jgi:DNA repair exonuclease SbcCD ATPase subunit